jgi:hypothetical protein
MPSVFREIPPLEFVKRFLELYGIYDMNMCQWFTKDQCSLDKAGDLLIEVHPYYIPCMGEFIDGSVSYDICIKVVRHILKAHGYRLNYIEKSRGGKQTWYKVDTNTRIRMEEVLISFE